MICKIWMNRKQLILVTLFITMLSVSSFVGPALAQAAGGAQTNTNPVGSVIFTAQQITDLSVLRDRAEKGITDAPIPANLQAYTTDSSGNKKAVKAIATIQKVKEILTPDGKTINSYVLTAFAKTQDPDSSTTQEDSTGSVEATVTMYYNMSLNNYQLTSGSVTYTILDGTVVMSNGILGNGEVGHEPNGTYFENMDNHGFNPSSGTWQYSESYPYVAINPPYAGAAIKTYQSCYLRHGSNGNPWLFTFPVQIGVGDW
jgi:hypothetical protein